MSGECLAGGVRLCYLAYPMSPDLGAANAVQTFHTCAELRRLDPDLLVIIPRLPFQASEFSRIGATHLLRIPVNKVTRFVKGTIWSYVERSLFAFEAGAFLALRRLGRRAFPQVIYIRDIICAFWFAVILGPALGVKVVYEAHDLEATNPSRSKSRLMRGLLRLLDRETLRRSAAVVSLTHAFAAYVANTGLKERSRLFVIPDAFDPAVYRPRDGQECRKSLGLPLASFVVVYSGLTFAYRRLDLLLRAFSAFRVEHEDSVMVLVGGREGEREQLSRLAKAMGIPAANILMPGRMEAEEIARHLNAADALVIPDTVSDISASPLKMFEYMAVGRPVVLPDMPALREILDDSSAYFFQRGDEDSLRAALAEVHSGQDADLKAERALERSRDFTYAERAARVMAAARAVLVE